VSARIAEAEAYVQSRFYPPLPVEYGALAVEAVERVNAGDDTPLDVTGLPVTPKAAYEVDGHLHITPEELVDALRLWHLIDTDDEEGAS
jgi:hypothetical protein